MNKDKTYNRGEWAELYVILKLLSDGRIYMADSLLKKNYNSYLDIIKIIRQEKESPVFNYIIDGENDVINILNDKNELLLSVPKSDFDKEAKVLLNDIMTKKGMTITASESVCDFATFIFIKNPKAPAVKSLKKQFGGKNDIFIEVRDPGTSIISIMGFSVKSKFKHPATLFNGGSSSQFLFKVKPCNDTIMDDINSFIEKGVDNSGKAVVQRKWGKVVEYLKENNINLSYEKVQYKTYENNLALISDNMDKILSWCYKDALTDSFSTPRLVKETTERLAKENPLNKPNPGVYYEKYMKDLLMSSFTGMTAGKVWDGKEQVSGGYIVVLSDGDVLCYHSADRESFRDYLYRNTHFDYISTKKYKWSYVFKKDDTYYLPLNMSIRFNQDVR